MDYSGDFNVDPSVLNWQTFYPDFSPWSSWQAFANFVYYPDPDQGSYFPAGFSWSWSPDESADTWGFGKWAAPYGTWIVTGDGVWMQTQPSAPVPTEQTLTYTATDLDGAQATAKYIMKFHDPYENWARAGAAVQGPDRVLSDPEFIPNANGGITSLEYKLAPDDFDIAPLAKSGEMVIANSLPAFVEITNASSEGPAGIAVAGLLGAAGYAAGTFNDSAKSTTHVNTGEAQFVQDANDQVRITNQTGKNVSSLPDVYVLSINRFEDTQLAAMIASAPPDIQSKFWNGTINTADPTLGYPPGTFTVTVVAAQETTIQTWTADWYDAYGPMLQSDGVTHQKLTATTTNGNTAVVAINTWTFNPSAPPYSLIGDGWTS